MENVPALQTANKFVILSGGMWYNVFGHLAK